ncbi:MAG TPA: hypothetical protein VGK52_10810 [Polyangia bacterium]
MTASAALASPLLIYTRWVGDPELDPRNPPGGFISYCDFGTQGNASVYNCVPNQKFDSPDGADDIPSLPDPLGGIGALDLNGDGKQDFLALTGVEAGQMWALAGSVEFTPGFGSVAVHVPPALFPDASADLGSKTNAVGFTVASGSDKKPKLFVARTTNGTDLIVDIFNVNGGVPTSVLLTVPGMSTVSRSAGADFLGFTADDEDGDGVAELMVAHAAPPGTDHTLINVFDINGAPLHTVTLNLDPVASDRAVSTFDETYVGGFARTQIVNGSGREFVILTVDHSPTTLGPRPGFPMKFTLWRFDGNGALVASLPNLLSVPFFSGAVVMGMTGMTGNDDNCNGIDEDGNGKIDDGYVVKTSTCGVGSCQVTTRSSCVGGVETPAAVCQPRPPSPERLNGLDDDCDGVVDDLPDLADCNPGQTDWWCCPGGADVHFVVNSTSDTQDEATAATSCLPVGVAPANALCSLRGVVRRAEQLRQRDNHRPACRVVAQLTPGDYQMSRNDGSSFLNFGGGILTLEGAGTAANSTVIEPAPTAPAGRLMWTGLQVSEAVANQLGEHSPQLTIQNLRMRGGDSGDVSQAGGGAVAMLAPQTGAVLTIQDSIFDQNQSRQEGGAVQFWTRGTLTVQRSVFRNNETSAALVNARGGAISAAVGAIVHIEDSTFVGNFGKFGGAIALDQVSSTLVNDTVSQNAGGVDGGGVFANGGTLSLRFNTLFNNAMVSTDDGPRAGAGLFTIDTTLSAFGNIIAGSDFFPVPGFDTATSPDCSVSFVSVPRAVTFGSNLIGAGGGDCALIGAPNGLLIGSATAPVKAQVNPLPALRGPNDILCKAGFPKGSNANCVPICNGMATSASCVNVPQTTAPLSPAIAAFPTGASPSGADDSCPLDDQRLFSRPDARCTLGAIDTNATMLALGNGNIQFSIRLPGPAAAYVEAFARQNGVQNVSGDIRSSQVANADGSFTYSKIVSGSSYHTGDHVDVRFYYYRANSPGIFVPGPSSTVWYPATTYRRTTATPIPTICRQTNGDMRFALTLGSHQAYVEAFAQQNGVQTVSGAITSSAVVNVNGTVTYTRFVPAKSFKSADVIRARFYHYEANAAGTFEPGPGEQIFYPSVVYSSAPVCP